MTESTNQAPPPSGQLTYADYCLLPEDGKRHEIIAGELHVSPAPTPRHQRILGRIMYSLMSAARESGSGEVFVSPIDVVFDDFNVVQPDILFISKERREIVGEKYIRQAPDLIVEILSPSTRRKDLLVKFNLYARLGTLSYWIVDPEAESIEMFVLEKGAYRSLGRTVSPDVLESPQFPGLRLFLDEVFRSA